MAQLFRTLRRKFGIAAPRVSVQTHVAWYWRWLGIIVLGAFVVGVGLTTYDYGMELAGFRQSEAARALAKLNDEILKREAAIVEMRTQVAAVERQLQENAALKEDLAFFQSLMASGAKELGLSINRFRVQPDALPGEYRYRMLLVQSGQRIKEFQGTLQFLVYLEQGDRKFVLSLPPEDQKNAREYQINFKFFQRVDGTFKVAPGTTVKSLQVRVFENGVNAPKLSQTASVS